MKIAIFDAFSGASGDMIVASLLGISLSEDDLRKIIDSTGINVEFKVKEVKKGVIIAKKIDVSEKYVERSYEEVKKIIEKANLDEKVKEDSLKIFKMIQDAEEKIHGDEKLHELGSDDAIFDILSSVTGIRNLISNGYKFYSMPIRLGRGFVKSKHGVIPVPAPITLELMKSKIPVIIDGEGELFTPTAAAIISYYCEKYNNFPFLVKEISYGAGTFEFSHPNVLRLILGERIGKDSVVLLETNIDDISCEILGYAAEKLRNIEGVLDVWILNAIGKKSRPTFELKVLAREEVSEEIAKEIMKLTGTLGVRVYPFYHRFIADREILKKQVEFLGKKFEVRFKRSEHRSKPEFDDVAKIAEETKIPLLKVLEKVVKDVDTDR